MNIYVKTPGGSVLIGGITKDDTLDIVFIRLRYYPYLEIPVHAYIHGIFHNGKRMNPDDTFGNTKLEDGDLLTLKPVATINGWKGDCKS